MFCVWLNSPVWQGCGCGGVMALVMAFFLIFTSKEAAQGQKQTKKKKNAYRYFLKGQIEYSESESEPCDKKYLREVS